MNPLGTEPGIQQTVCENLTPPISISTFLILEVRQRGNPPASSKTPSCGSLGSILGHTCILWISPQPACVSPMPVASPSLVLPGSSQAEAGSLFLLYTGPGVKMLPFHAALHHACQVCVEWKTLAPPGHLCPALC